MGKKKKSEVARGALGGLAMQVMLDDGATRLNRGGE